jgi:hypothetical protein
MNRLIKTLMAVLLIAGFSFQASAQLSKTLIYSKQRVWNEEGYDANPEMWVATYSTDNTAVSADRYIVAVDRSSTAYPHSQTASRVDVHGAIVSASMSAAGSWMVKFGIAEEVDAASGDIQYFAHVPLVSNGRTFETLDFGHAVRGAITSLNTTEIIGNDEDADDTAIQTDSGSSAVNILGTANSVVGAGDVIIKIDELTGTASADVNITLFYTVH